MEVGVILRTGWRAEVPGMPRPEAAFTRLRDEAGAAIAAGAAALFAYDHLEAVPDSRDAPCFEAWTTLSALAAAFPGTRIGTLVSGVSLRNTGLLAKMAVTVDAISGGNVVLGLGAGWYRSELNHHGIPVLPFAQRAAATGEACQALRALWAGHPVTAEVGTTMLREAVCAPGPVKGSIPIWIGGSSAAMQEVAASSADGISLGGTPQEIRALIDSVTCRLASRQRARERFTFSAEVQVAVSPSDDELSVLASRSGTTPEDFATWNIVGSPERILERVAEYQDAGLNMLIAFPPLARSVGDVAAIIGLVRQGVRTHA